LPFEILFLSLKILKSTLMYSSLNVDKCTKPCNCYQSYHRVAFRYYLPAPTVLNRLPIPEMYRMKLCNLWVSLLDKKWAGTWSLNIKWNSKTISPKNVGEKPRSFQLITSFQWVIKTENYSNISSSSSTQVIRLRYKANFPFFSCASILTYPIL
jgi:hypothetical protein